MGVFTLQLETGTNVTRTICLPASGGWQGLVAFGMSTAADATIKSAIIYYNVSPSEKWGRRVGGNSGNNWQNWTLTTNTRPFWWLLGGESILKLNYDATSPISVCVETYRGYPPYAHPRAVGSPYGNPENGIVFAV